MCSVWENMTGVTEFGVGESQKTTGVKTVYFVFVFLFNGSIIMLRGLQVSSFSMLLYVYDILIIKERVLIINMWYWQAPVFDTM